jgi:hypothetical protein
MTCFIYFIPETNRAELDELGASHAGNDFSERGLAGAGRPPENQRADVVALDLSAKRFAGANQVLLTDIFVERARTHAIGKGTTLIVWVIAAGNGLKEAHESYFTTETRRHGENKS